MDSINLTDKSKEALTILSDMIPEVDSEFLTETALLLTATLYQKISEGAIVQVKTVNGKIEELRFKAKKSIKRKAKP